MEPWFQKEMRKIIKIITKMKNIESTCFTRNCCSGLVSKPARQVAEDGEVEGEAEEEGGR